MDKKQILKGNALEKAKELMALTEELFIIPRLWIVAVLIFVVISMFDVNQTFEEEQGKALTIGFKITTTTVIILALIWLPPVLKIFATLGGGIKTGAGEANTPGLLKSLTEMLAVLDSTKENLDEEQKKQVEQISQQAEKQIAQSLAPDAEEARRQVLQIAREYDETRKRLQKGDYRTRKITTLMTQVRALASQGMYSPQEIRVLYQSGEGGERVAALSLLRALPESGCFDLVLKSITDSKSAFEQYIALRLASEMLGILDEVNKRKLVEAIQEQSQPGRGHYLSDSDPDRSRWRTAQQILKGVGNL